MYANVHVDYGRWRLMVLTRYDVNVDSSVGNRWKFGLKTVLWSLDYFARMFVSWICGIHFWKTVTWNWNEKKVHWLKKFIEIQLEFSPNRVWSIMRKANSPMDWTLGVELWHLKSLQTSVEIFSRNVSGMNVSYQSLFHVIWMQCKQRLMLPIPFSYHLSDDKSSVAQIVDGMCDWK